MDDVADMWQEKNIMSKLRSGPGRVAVLYLAGLVGCIIAGLASPGLFISKTAVFSPPGPDAGNSASGVYEFDISDYKRSHQSVYLAMRLNLPIQLQQSMDLNGHTRYEAEGQHAIAVYGSQQPFLASEDCPNGCLTCPAGSDALGLTCDLISAESTGDETIVCEGGDEWCSWLSLYSLNFVMHETYYWMVETENRIDDYITAANATSNEDWVSEFRVVFVSRWYTTFELVWFYCWFFATLLVMFLPRHGFFAQAITTGVLWSKWSRLQKWVSVMLGGLLFFNNPFVAVQIFSDAPKPFFIWYALMEGVFVSLLLLFWADRIFEAGFGQNESRTKGGTARGAGVVLIVLLCIVYVVNMIDLRVSRNGNPDRVHKYPYTSTAAEKMLTVLCLVYCFWVVALSGRAWWWGGKVSDKIRTSRRVQFFVAASLASMLLVLPAIILEYLQPRVRGGPAFTLSHGGVNLYVMVLALLCAPRNAENKTYDDDDDDMSAAGRTVNPIAHQRAIEVVEGQGPDYKESSVKWWQGKQRPKIRDSSMWEDTLPAKL
eukprot:g3119.t1